MARTGKATNLYFPDEDSDIFEWNENDFIYQARRDELNGTNEGATNHFNEVLADIETKLNEATQTAINTLNELAGSEINY
jgi:thymidylate synthase (FAD)